MATAKREWASSRAKSPEHFKQLLNEPGQYQQRPSEKYRDNFDKIFKKEGECPSDEQST